MLVSVINFEETKFYGNGISDQQPQGGGARHEEEGEIVACQILAIYIKKGCRIRI